VADERIWAPWRLAYIKGDKKESAQDLSRLEFLPDAAPDCFLCQAAADPESPHRHVVQRGDAWIAVLNRYPYNNGHLLVAPLKHLSRLDELTQPERSALTEGVTRMIGLLEGVLRPEGFNVGLNLGHAAGAGLPGHLHWHIVPRWVGDTNFMPTLASVNVIPQSLDALWEMLTTALAGG